MSRIETLPQKTVKYRILTIKYGFSIDIFNMDTKTNTNHNFYFDEILREYVYQSKNIFKILKSVF